MSVIWKFKLHITDQQEIKMPGRVQPLSVQMQDRELVLWAIVEPGDPTYSHSVFVVGTGFTVPDGALHHRSKYVGTVQDEHELVWHVFIGL